MKQMEFEKFTVSITKKGKITIKPKMFTMNVGQKIEHIGWNNESHYMCKKVVLLPDAPLGSKLKID